MRGLCAMVLCFGVGCAGTEVGNPVKQTQIALTAQSSDEDVVLWSGDEPSGAVLIESMWVGLGDMRFVQDSQCDRDRDTRITIEGPTIAELVAEPHVIEVDLPVADYCRVRVSLVRLRKLPGSAPDELEDHSIVLTGERQDGEPFLLRSDDTREFEVRSKGEPFGIGLADHATILAFDAARWLDGIDLMDAVPNDDGDILIEDGENDDLLDTFEDNVKRSLRLFRDLDADGELDAGDLDELLADGE